MSQKPYCILIFSLASLNEDPMYFFWLYDILWDVLKFITPLCIGIPILMGGAGFITSFYQAEKDVIRLQLYRHIAVAVYFELGAMLFLIYPVLKRVLLIRGT